MVTNDEILIVVEQSDGHYQRIRITKGSETIWLDIDLKVSKVYVNATTSDGGYLVASLKFDEDRVTWER